MDWIEPDDELLARYGTQADFAVTELVCERLGLTLPPLPVPRRD